jgi:MATE family multidrug resistance protein
MGMQLKGVALGTMIGQWAGFLFSLILSWKKYKVYFKRKFYWAEILDTDALVQYFHVNKNIFGRTLCLIAVTTSFTAFGAKQGETILAVNTLMMQLFTIFSYFMDGFAYAGEAIAGASVGEKDTLKLYETVHSLFFWGWVLAFSFTIIYVLGGQSFLGFLTDQKEILGAADPYIEWSTLIPLCGFSAFMWDGIYIGMTETKMMFRVMFFSMLLYFVLYFVLFPVFGNHGLWIAFLFYLCMRGCGLWYYFSRKFKCEK